MEIPHIGQNQRVLVICVKFRDIPSTRLPRAQDWVDLLNRQVTGFYNQSTFNKTSFTFETVQSGPSDGWFQLNWNHDSIAPGVTWQGFFVERDTQRTIDLVEQQAPSIDFSPYNRLLIITNSHTFYGSSPNAAFNLFRVNHGGEVLLIKNESGNRTMSYARAMTTCAVHEWQAGNVSNFDGAAFNIAHELGHNLGCRDHYDLTITGGRPDVITPWSLMGYTPDPLSYAPTHQLGWSKYDRAWLVSDDTNRSRIRVLGPPRGTSINERIILKPHETFLTDGTQLILVSFRESSFPLMGYAIENRQRLNGDDGIPETGVLISRVDATPGIFPNIVVQTNPRFPDDLNKAPLKLNDSFRDNLRNITITVEREISNDYEVRVQYPLPSDRRPNPIITPWRAPPWETPDIWFDSERNGWGTYRYTDGSGNPVGNGDAPWLNHDNRIYVRISNVGHGDAINVRVRVYYTVNPNIGNDPSAWNQIGTIVYPLIEPGRDAVDSIIWRPTVNTHTCIKAVIEESADYENNLNKEAQENIAIFETSRGSPWSPIHIKSQIHNPYSKPISVILNVANVPDDWTIELDSFQLNLDAHAQSDIDLSLYPSPPTDIPGDSPGESDKYKVGFVAKPRIEALVPFRDTFVLLGGIETWVHLVEKTTITCDSVEVTSDSVLVEGTIKPDVKESTIGVEIRSDEEKRDISFTLTESGGHYTAKFKRPSVGAWTAKAFFDGSDTASSAESNEREFVISQE
jgi:M6 family metalloprotease-like protein